MSRLADALMTARVAKGWTQQQLADISGLSQEAISRYETERRVPELDALGRLAGALGVTPAFLESLEKERGAWAIDAHLRRRATARAGVWRRQEARLNMLRSHARYLYEEINIRAEYTVPTYDPIFAAPDEAARMTRMHWRMPVGPVRSITGWMEGAGCLVIEEDFGTDRVDGLSQWLHDHPVILLNVTAPTDRKRLTLAHELGHLCLHSHDVGEDIEQEANMFAAEFLMPAEVIRPQLRNLSIGKLIDLKRTWGVSIQALIERARGLGLMKAEQRTAMYKQLSAKGWRKREPASDELAPEHPRLALEIGLGLESRGLSPSEIAQVTGFSEVSPDNPFIPPQRGLRLA